MCLSFSIPVRAWLKARWQTGSAPSVFPSRPAWCVAIPGYREGRAKNAGALTWTLWFESSLHQLLLLTLDSFLSSGSIRSSVSPSSQRVLS